MTMSLRADESAPIPRPVTMTLSCDRIHGLFDPPARLEVELAADHPWTEAGRRGWSVTAERVLCPDCMGRKPS